MTKDQLDKLTPEEKRVRIAEALGWVWSEEIHEQWWNALWTRGRDTLIPRGEDLTTRRRNRPDVLPDYLSDLNAMHEAEKTLTGIQQDAYTNALGWPADNGPHAAWKVRHATAAQLADAFLLTQP